MSSASSPLAPSAVAGDSKGASFMTLVDAAASEFDTKPTSPSKAPLASESVAVSVSTSSTNSDSSVDGSMSSDKQPTPEGSLDKKLSFAEQLMSILDDEGYADVLHWMPDGKSFTITNPKKFTAEEMPKLFNIRNMSSFVRKLTRWGFSRVHEKETMNSDIFKHPQFQKGNHKLCSEIKCTGRTSASSSSLKKPSLEAIKAFRESQLQKASHHPVMSVSPPNVPKPVHLPTANHMGSFRTGDHVPTVDPRILAATVESIRRERELANMARCEQLANILNLRHMMEVSQQPQPWLTAARAEQLLRLERAQLGDRVSWGGFPALY